MNINPSDGQLLQLLDSAVPQDISDVLRLLEAIDGLLPSSDGLKWFNLLYLLTTREIQNRPPQNGWQNPQWVVRLDVVFAHFYAAVLRDFLRQSNSTPSSWQALFECRNKAGIERIQLAIAGMNAHINRDLSLVLLETERQMNFSPTLGGPEFQDFEHVNSILEIVMPQALDILADGGLIGEVAENSGTVGKLLAIWNVRQARSVAWIFADHLRDLGGLRRRAALVVQDKTTGALGRSLLLELH